MRVTQHAVKNDRCGVQIKIIPQDTRSPDVKTWKTSDHCDSIMFEFDIRLYRM